MTAGVIVDESALKDLATRRYLSVNGLGQSFDDKNTEVSSIDEGGEEVISSGENEIPTELLATLMEAELDRFRSLVLSALPYDATRGDSVTISTAPFYVDAPQEYQLPWHKDPAILEWGRHGMTSLGLIAFFLIVVAPVLRAYLPSKDDDVEALLAEQLADGELSLEDRQALEDGEALDEIKAKLKPKKSAISADMLDTANSYDDKVAIVRLLVAEDAGRVANVLKKMIKPV
jgi:flagellar M-ring protein FliF